LYLNWMSSLFADDYFHNSLQKPWEELKMKKTFSYFFRYVSEDAGAFIENGNNCL
jgi:hypothetical protein